MFQRLVIYLVCMSVSGMYLFPYPVYAAEQGLIEGMNEAELLAKYPEATVIRVAPQAYPALAQSLRQRGYIQSGRYAVKLAASDSLQELPAPVESRDDLQQDNLQQDDLQPVDLQQYDTRQRDDCAGSGSESSGEQSFRIMGEFTDDLMRSGNGASGDSAAIVFIIIGTIVLVVWALYIFKYVYDVTLGIQPCGRWRELTLVSSASSSGDDQHARFNGVRYSTGFRDVGTDVGISFELGQADILLKEASVLELKGRYWLLGPMLRWRLSRAMNPSYFQMNFTAGSTEHGDVGLIARASLGLLFGIGDAIQLGLNWGALNIKLDEDQGIISDRSQYHYLYGINFGFRF